AHISTMKMRKRPGGCPRSGPPDVVPAEAGTPFRELEVVCRKTLTRLRGDDHLSSVHQVFDFLGLDRNLRAEILGAALLHDDIVLQAHAEAFLGNVDAGLDRDHPAFLER